MDFGSFLRYGCHDVWEVLPLNIFYYIMLYHEIINKSSKTSRAGGVCLGACATIEQMNLNIKQIHVKKESYLNNKWAVKPTNLGVEIRRHNINSHMVKSHY